MKIKLNLNGSLGYDNNNKLQVQTSSETGNTLNIEPDGLYAQAIPGESGSSGTGFASGYRSANGVMSGVDSPYDMTVVPKRIVAPAITHRIFTCNNTDGSDISLRSVDYMFPGDMYRIKNSQNNTWDYYVIISVNNNGKGVYTHSGVVASIPLSREDVN